jgi:hypothetical protein
VPLDWSVHFERDTALRGTTGWSFGAETEKILLYGQTLIAVHGSPDWPARLYTLFLISHLVIIGLLEMFIMKRIAASWPYLLISISLIGLAYDAWKSLIAR